MKLIAIDPGARAGFALFGHDNRLVRCGQENYPTGLGDIDRAVIECPTIYPHSQVPPNDIVTLAISAGRIAGYLSVYSHSPIEWVLPRQWKGQVPKPKTRRWVDYIVHKRVMARLTADENRVYMAALAGVPATCCDVTDAVGLALWALGRRS